MNIDDLVVDKSDENSLFELVSALKEEKNSAFVGAGLSVDSEYPVWKQFISSLTTEIGLNPLLSNDKSEVSDVDFAEVAEECYNQNPDLYRKIVLEKFGMGNYTFNDYIRQLISIGFDLFLTTNFDECLFAAGIKGELKFYPTLENDLLNTTGVIYLHGRAFKVKGETDDSFNFCVDSLVLRKSVYDDAYATDGSGNGKCASLLKRICEEYNIVFCGFSFEDSYFFKTLMNIQHQLKKGDELNKRYKPNYPDQRKKIFIFRAENCIRPNDYLLMEFENIKYIRYKLKDEKHTNLKQIFQNIFNLRYPNSYPTLRF